MGQKEYITNLREYEGLSLREISRRTGFHYKTVKKYVEGENWNEEIRPRKERASKLDELKPVINEWLENDLKMPGKQRHRGTRVYERLNSEAPYKGKLLVGKQSVINYVSKVKREILKTSYDTAIFGEHEYGEAQVDLGEVYAYNENGIMSKYYELVMSYPASNGGYAQICKSQNTECLLEGMQRIFEYIGGVPRRILFDNMSSAVAKTEPKGKRKLTDAFSRFVLHHRFKAVFCNPDKGQEKGSVENKVGYKRRNMFVPVPTIADLAEFNRNLFLMCDEDMNRNHYMKKEPIRELFKADKAAMHPLPQERFRVTRLEKVKSDKYSFVSFENNKYSTSPEYYRCELWLEVNAEYIRILNEKYEQVGEHKRIYEQQGEPIVNWLNYLEAISRKPNSLRYTGFFKNLPDVWQKYFRECGYDERKKMFNALVPIIQEGHLDEATIVMQIAHIKDSDDFMACYRSMTESMIKPTQVTTKNTPAQTPYVHDLSVYSDLMGGE